MSWPFLLEMVWKSSAIATATLLLAELLRSRSAADRAAVLRIGAALLLLLPLLSVLMPVLKVEVQSAPEVQPFFREAVERTALASAGVVGSPSAGELNSGSPTFSSGFLALFVTLLYCVGATLVAARVLTDLSVLRRWTLAAERVSSNGWMRAFDRVKGRLGLENVSLLTSPHAPGPLSWGWRKPVILLDRGSYARAEDAEAVLAHEAAHLLRRDWAALMLFRLTTVFFWFNPIVWLLARRFVHYAEAAADCEAARQVGQTRYAQALLDCARRCRRGPAAANSIISSSLVQRVQLVVAGPSLEIRSGSGLTWGAIAGSVGLAATIAALKPVSATASATSPAAQAETAGTSTFGSPSAPTSSISRSAPLAAASKTSEGAPRHSLLAPLRTPLPASALPSASYPLPDPASLESSNFQEPTADEPSASGDGAARLAEKTAEIARAAGRSQMSQSANHVETSADHVQISAGHLAEEAVNLRDPAYREEKIAEHASRGRVVTHQQLLDSIPELSEKSRELLKQSAQMRRDAADLRRRSLE